jgi:flagellar hook-length control protein FliK
LPASAQAGVQNLSDNAKDSGAVGADFAPPAPIIGKAAKPFIAAILHATAQSDGAKAGGPLVPADPNGSVDSATKTADQPGPNASVSDRHGDKTDKSAASDSAQAQPQTVPVADSTLNSLVAPVPQPAAPATGAPSAAAGDDDGVEITELAAAGNATRPSRSGAPTAGADAAAATPSAQSDAGAGEEDGTQAPTQPSSVPAPNSPIRPGRANASSPQPPPDAFPKAGVEPDGNRNIHPHGASRASGEGAVAVPARGQPSITGDQNRQASITTAPNPDTAPTPASDSTPVDHNAPANPPPDAGGSPATADSLAAPAGAAPPASTPPAAQAGAPAPTTASPAVSIAGLAVEIAGRAHAGKNRFEIRLDPPDLGRIDVRLDVDHDGKVTSHLVVERQETLDVLRRDAPQIERSLQQAGLKTADNGLQFTLRDQGFGQQNPYPRYEPLPGGLRIVVPDADLPTAEAGKGRYGGIAGLGSGIDIRV